MRVLNKLCKDSKTGYELLADQCSYNQACAWLYKILKAHGREVCRAFVNHDTGLTEIWTAEWSDRICNYKPTRHYFYDEERGYLLGE